MKLLVRGVFFFSYEYAIRLETKDKFFGCHEFYCFPFPLCSTSPPYFRTRVFRGFSGLLGFEKKIYMGGYVKSQLIPVNTSKYSFFSKLGKVDVEKKIFKKNVPPSPCPV